MGQVNYSETIEARPEQVWAVLADVARLPDWAYTDGRFPYPVEGKYGSDQQEGAGTIWIGVAADGQTATQKITVWEAPRKLAYELQQMEHAPLLMAQTNTFELEAVGESTKVTWTVDWELTGGFSLTKLLLRFSAGGAFEEMIAGSLENLKLVVEKEATASAGEEAQPEPALQQAGEETEPEASAQGDLAEAEPPAVGEDTEVEAGSQEAEEAKEPEKR
jgi:uncharacterized protein YndB with AHSA1/START domain